jgi:hypothetical protein
MSKGLGRTLGNFQASNMVVVRIPLSRNMSTTVSAKAFLKVDGQQVIDGGGETIILKGAGLGGWMKYVMFLLLISKSKQIY